MTQRLSFHWLRHQGVGEGATLFPGLLHFTLDPYIIILSVKQGGIKYHFFSLVCGWQYIRSPLGVEHSGEGIYGCRSHNGKLFEQIEYSVKCKQTNKMQTNEGYYLMPYNSLADMVHLLAEQSDTKSSVKLGGFRSQLQASYVSSHTEELWYNETVFLWMASVYCKPLHGWIEVSATVEWMDVNNSNCDS